MSKKRASHSLLPTSSRKLSSIKDQLLHKGNDGTSSKDHRLSPAQRRSSTSISESLSTSNSRSTVPGALKQPPGGRRSTLEFPSARKRRREETESGEVGQAVSTLSHVPGPISSTPRRSSRISRRPNSLVTTPAASMISVATSQEEPEHPFITNMQIHKPGRGPKRTKFFRGKLDTQSPVNLISIKKVQELGLQMHVRPISDMNPIRLRTIGKGPGSVITPTSSVMITWHTNKKDHITYTKEFHILPPTFPEPAFDCLIGWETIQQEKFLHRNEDICYLEIVK